MLNTRQEATFWTSSRGLVVDAGGSVRTELQWSRREITSPWMSTWAASLVRKGPILMMLHGRNLQKMATATMFAESDNSLFRVIPWSRSGQITAQTSLTLKKHKIRLVEAELRVVTGEGSLILFSGSEGVLGDF